MSDRLESVQGAVAVVTGGAAGIGLAMARRFSAEGAAHVVVADVDVSSARSAVKTFAGPATTAHLDVTDADAVGALIDEVESTVGPIGLWCGNAGVLRGSGLGEPADWRSSWAVHVDAQVTAARVLSPRMSARGGGRLVLVASAAGLLTSLDSAPYAVTKHATVALAEWLAITYADDGINVHCVCPQAVHTAMTVGAADTLAVAGQLMEPDDVAEALIRAIEQQRFLVLPHPEVADYERQRTADRDRWLTGMKRLRRTLPSVVGPPSPNSAGVRRTDAS